MGNATSSEETEEQRFQDLGPVRTLSLLSCGGVVILYIEYTGTAWQGL